jgi:hypothetical protein
MRNVTFLTMFNNTRVTESYGHYSEKIAAAKATPHADKDIPLGNLLVLAQTQIQKSKKM